MFRDSMTQLLFFSGFCEPIGKELQDGVDGVKMRRVFFALCGSAWQAIMRFHLGS